MFTGLIEEMGECLWLRRTASAVQLMLSAHKITLGLHKGDSVAINGCCLTVIWHRKDHLSFELLQETLDRTNLGALRPEAPVNLERSLPAHGRLGGHFVQGHVDTAASVRHVDERGPDLKLEIELPPAFARYVVAKGSIAINGVSLTVAELSASSFVVWIIPHTRNTTNLGNLKAGGRVNLEFDILAKYAERIMTFAKPPAAGN